MEIRFITMTEFWSWWREVDNEHNDLARTFLFLSVVTLLLLWYKRTSTYFGMGMKPFPPGPYGLPIVGYLPFLRSNLHERFTEMAHIYGPIFSLRLGRKLHVVVNSMDLAKVVARDQDQILANRSPPLTGLINSYGGNNISWSNNNFHWRNMRKLLVSQVLSSANLKASQHFRTLEVRKMVNKVCANLGKKIDINEIAFKTEVNVVTSMLWGSSKSGEANDSSYLGAGFREVESKIIELLGAPNISDFLPTLSWFDLQGRQREMRTQTEYLDRILDNIIQERIKANSSKTKGRTEDDGMKDFLQVLLEIKEREDVQTLLNIRQIKSLLMEIVVAATDSTSVMVEWVMAEILHNPTVKKRIQDELIEVVGTNIVEESHLPKLSYLDAVIKETFRLHTPLPLLIQRCPDKSCIVGGYTIPKDTIVYINVWAIQRDPKNWSNPLEFNPERFLNGRWDYSGKDFKFFPFGAGRRMCPGLPLGEKMLKYILASLLNYFEWSLPEDEELDLSDEFGFVTKKRKPLIAIPSQRLSNESLSL